MWKLITTPRNFEDPSHPVEGAALGALVQVGPCVTEALSGLQERTRFVEWLGSVSLDGDQTFFVRCPVLRGSKIFGLHVKAAEERGVDVLNFKTETERATVEPVVITGHLIGFDGPDFRDAPMVLSSPTVVTAHWMVEKGAVLVPPFWRPETPEREAVAEVPDPDAGLPEEFPRGMVDINVIHGALGFLASQDSISLVLTEGEPVRWRIAWDTALNMPACITLQGEHGCDPLISRLFPLDAMQTDPDAQIEVLELETPELVTRTLGVWGIEDDRVQNGLIITGPGR